MTFNEWRAEIVRALNTTDQIIRAANDELLDLYHNHETPESGVALLRAKYAAGVTALFRQPAEEDWAQAPAETADVALTLIDVLQDNPRGPATAEEIAAKIYTLQREGQLSPIGLRRTDAGRYELWWGERRYRAAQHLGWTTIRADVFAGDVPTDVLRSKRAAENLYQQDLNPIQRAKHLDELLRSHGWTPETDDDGKSAGPSLRALSKEVGLSQGEISNTLGLLKLPADWQQRLMSHEITPTQGRLLVPWIHRPTLLQAVAKLLKKRNKQDELTTSGFERLFWEGICEVSRPTKPGAYLGYNQSSYQNNYVKLTAKEFRKHREELDLETVGGGRDAEVRAFNVKRFDEMQADAVKREEAKRSKGAQASTSSGQAARKLTPAQQRAKAKEQAEQLERRVARYKTRWLQEAAAERALKKVEGHLGTKLLLYFAAVDPQARPAEIANIITNCKGDRKGGRNSWDVDVWGTLSSLPTDGAFVEAARHYLADRLQADVESSRCGLRAADVPAIAAELGVEFTVEWRVDRDFLELFTKDQLFELALEWKLTGKLAPVTKRGDLIAEILAADAHPAEPLGVPKILAKAKT